MRLIWQKGRFSWIASHPNRTVQPDEHFPLAEAPENAAILALSEQLLSYGGEAVVVLFVEERSCSFFYAKGEIASYNSISLEVGEQSECHANSAKLWKGKHAKLHLVTGYGLSEDKLWRRHSWLISNEQNLVETTKARVKYFGVRLSKNKQIHFVMYISIVRAIFYFLHFDHKCLQPLNTF